MWAGVVAQGSLDNELRCVQVPGDGAAMPSGSVGGGKRQSPSQSVVLQEARASKQRLHALSQPDPLDGRQQ